MRRPSSRKLAGGLAVAALLTIVGWWTWPSWSGAGDDLDVVLVTDPTMAAGADTILAALHGDGRTAEYAPTEADWCAAAPAAVAAVAERSPATVVLSFADLGACGTDGVAAAVAAAGGRHVVVIAQPGDAAAAVAAGVPGARVVDAARLVGGELRPAARPCMWWDECPATGLVVTRDAQGQLTPAGFDRVARLLVTTS